VQRLSLNRSGNILSVELDFFSLVIRHMEAKTNFSKTNLNLTRMMVEVPPKSEVSSANCK